jgi:hypothetical protein
MLKTAIVLFGFLAACGFVGMGPEKRKQLFEKGFSFPKKSS